MDLVARPHMYVNDAIPDVIVRLRMEYGTAVQFPNAAQRASLMTQLFGKSDMQKPDAASAASFQAARAVFFMAATAYTERTQNAPAAPLEDRVRSSLVPLRAHFAKLKGRGIALSGDQILNCFNAAVEVLKSPGVAIVFGQDQVEEVWPFGASNPKGAKLIEAIGAVLPIANELKFTSTRFVLLQRLATAGGVCIKDVLTKDDSAPTGLGAIVTSGYAWASAYRDFQQG